MSKKMTKNPKKAKKIAAPSGSVAGNGGCGTSVSLVVAETSATSAQFL